jgi:hypothetical protein
MDGTVQMMHCCKQTLTTLWVATRGWMQCEIAASQSWSFCEAISMTQGRCLPVCASEIRYSYIIRYSYTIRYSYATVKPVNGSPAKWGLSLKQRHLIWSQTAVFSANCPVKWGHLSIRDTWLVQRVSLFHRFHCIRYSYICTRLHHKGSVLFQPSGPPEYSRSRGTEVR